MFARAKVDFKLRHVGVPAFALLLLAHQLEARQMIEVVPQNHRFANGKRRFAAVSVQQHARATGKERGKREFTRHGANAGRIRLDLDQARAQFIARIHGAGQG